MRSINFVLRAIQETVIDMRSRPLVPILIVLISGLATFAIAATAGKTAMAETQVIQSIDSTASRTVVITVTGDQSISSHAVTDLLGIEPAVWSIAFSGAEDAEAIPTGARIPTRQYADTLPPNIRLVEGRPPEPGEAILSSDSESATLFRPALGEIRTQAGTVIPIVGRFEATGPLTYLTGSALIRPKRFPGARTVVLETSDFGQVETTTRSALALSGLPGEELAVDETAAANDVRAAIAGTLGQFSRSMVIYATAISATTLGAVTMVSAALRKREIGRRRALGATRLTVFSMVVGQVVIGSTIGSLLGAIGSQLVALNGRDGLTFGLATSYLMVLMCALGAVPAAALASGRDPVRVLRLP